MHPTSALPPTSPIAPPNIICSTNSIPPVANPAALAPPAAINGTVPNGTNNFGLTYALSDHTLVLNASGSASATPVGFQNPSSNGLIFSPQIRPLPKPFAQCPSGRDCCNNLTVQSGHATLNVCMADGSVRTVASSISLDTWRRVLLPNDGPPGTDW